MEPLTVKCGGHITLIFSIWKDARLARFQGSRGAGFNVIDGVEVTFEQIFEKYFIYLKANILITPIQADFSQIYVKPYLEFYTGNFMKSEWMIGQLNSYLEKVSS